MYVVECIKKAISYAIEGGLQLMYNNSISLMEQTEFKDSHIYIAYAELIKEQWTTAETL